jgi:hypothetical protein
MAASWVVAPCRLIWYESADRVDCLRHHGDHPDNGGGKNLWNVGKLIPLNWRYNLEDSHLCNSIQVSENKVRFIVFKTAFITISPTCTTDCLARHFNRKLDYSGFSEKYFRKTINRFFSGYVVWWKYFRSFRSTVVATCAICFSSK